MSDEQFVIFFFSTRSTRNGCCIFSIYSWITIGRVCAIVLGYRRYWCFFKRWSWQRKKWIVVWSPATEIDCRDLTCLLVLWCYLRCLNHGLLRHLIDSWQTLESFETRVTRWHLLKFWAYSFVCFLRFRKGVHPDVLNLFTNDNDLLKWHSQLREVWQSALLRTQEYSKIFLATIREIDPMLVEERVRWLKQITQNDMRRFYAIDDDAWHKTVPEQCSWHKFAIIQIMMTDMR